MSIGEAPDEGKLHVRFCEGHSKLIAPANVGDKESVFYSIKVHFIAVRVVQVNPEIVGFTR